MNEQTLAEWFKEKRFDPAFHLALGDIRLTIGDQEEAVALTEAMLNEYETLKAATERLSAEMATKLATMVKREWEGVYSWSGWQPEHDALKAYASILEGKDD